MLTIHGNSQGIDKPLLGKIALSPVSKKERSSTILVNPNLLKNKLTDYAALILSKKNEDNIVKTSGIPTVFINSSGNLLEENDIVEILPNGKILVLYKKKSNHNIIFVTSKCDSNCIMCPQPINQNEENLTNSNLKFISLIDKSTSELALTGGEPTLIGEDLFRLILVCKSFLPNTSLLLLTNARKFSNFDYTHLYSSLRHPHITVSTSLYGDNDIEHDFIVGSKGAFNETIKGLLNLATYNNPIEIRTVIHNYTYRNLPRLSEYIYRNLTFVRHIAFMGLETFWRAKINLKSLWIEPKEFIKPLEEAIHCLRQRNINTSIYNIPLCLLPKNLWIYARQSISDWKESFASKCHSCLKKEECSGMFESGLDIYKKYLKPIN